MYADFFKLSEMPFPLAPDCRFLFASAGHSAALQFLSSVRSTHRCVALTGERGLGKTLLLEHMRATELGEPVLCINVPPRSVKELKVMLGEFAAARPPDELTVICDNAQLLGSDVLMELLGSGSPGARVILAGEPALENTLRGLAVSGRPWGAQHRLLSLTAPEVHSYILHRLKIAGAGANRIFSEEVSQEIHRETRGVPRLINAACDAALVFAFERELAQVGSAEVRRALEDLGRLATAKPDDEPAQEIATVPQGVTHEAGHVMARLHVLHEGKLLFERELTRGRLRIGRAPENELQIAAEVISRHHCQILTSERMCLVEDVRSTNGLHVNGRRVRNHRLRDGDSINIGKHELQYFDLR